MPAPTRPRCRCGIRSPAGAEPRTTIVDPLTGRERPVVGVPVSFASAVGAGGPSFIFPNNWDVIGRLRDIPDTAVQFNGYFIGIDWFVFNVGVGGDRFKSTGNAFVRNVELPAGYLHVSVPVTGHLPNNPAYKAFIDAYRPTTEQARRVEDARLLFGQHLLRRGQLARDQEALGARAAALGACTPRQRGIIRLTRPRPKRAAARTAGTV